MKGEAARWASGPWWTVLQRQPPSLPALLLWPLGWSLLDTWTEWRAHPAQDPGKVLTSKTWL